MSSTYKILWSSKFHNVNNNKIDIEISSYSNNMHARNHMLSNTQHKTHGNSVHTYTNKKINNNEDA